MSPLAPLRSLSVADDLVHGREPSSTACPSVKVPESQLKQHAGSCGEKGPEAPQLQRRADFQATGAGIW